MNTSLEMLAIAARVERLERGNRVLKRLGLTVFLAVGAVVATAQAPTKRTVVADEFVLRDDIGAKRATLAFVRGNPTLTLIDEAGQARVAVDTEAIELRDSNGTSRVLLGSSNAVTYQLVGGKAQVLFEGPGLLFYGADKKAMVDLRGMSDGGALYFYGQSGANSDANSSSRQQVVLRSSADGPSLELSDAQGFKAVVGSVSLKTPSTGASSRTSAASVALFDKDGRSIWSKP